MMQVEILWSEHGLEKEKIAFNLLHPSKKIDWQSKCSEKGTEKKKKVVVVWGMSVYDAIIGVSHKEVLFRSIPI